MSVCEQAARLSRTLPQRYPEAKMTDQGSKAKIDPEASSENVSESASSSVGYSIKTKTPEGGLKSWLTVLGSSLVYFSAFGIINSFGFFQELYNGNYLQSTPPSTISFIGTIQILLMNLLAAPAGSLFDCFGLKVSSPSLLHTCIPINTKLNIAVAVHLLRHRHIRRLNPPLRHPPQHPLATLLNPGSPPRRCNCLRRAACSRGRWTPFLPPSIPRHGHCSRFRKRGWCLLSPHSGSVETVGRAGLDITARGSYHTVCASRTPLVY